MLTYNDQTTVWKFVEEARKKIFSAKTEPDCELTTQNGNIIKADYGEIMENIDKQLNTFSNYDFQENVSTKILQKGAEMFTYLYFCPPKKLSNFFREVFSNGGIKDIVMAVTNIVKTRRNAEKQA